MSFWTGLAQGFKDAEAKRERDDAVATEQERYDQAQEIRLEELRMAREKHATSRRLADLQIRQGELNLNASVIDSAANAYLNGLNRPSSEPTDNQGKSRSPNSISSYFQANEVPQEDLQDLMSRGMGTEVAQMLIEGYEKYKKDFKDAPSSNIVSFNQYIQDAEVYYDITKEPTREEAEALFSQMGKEMSEQDYAQFLRQVRSTNSVSVRPKNYTSLLSSDEIQGSINAADKSIGQLLASKVAELRSAVQDAGANPSVELAGRLEEAENQLKDFNNGSQNVDDQVRADSILPVLANRAGALDYNYGIYNRAIDSVTFESDIDARAKVPEGSYYVVGDDIRVSKGPISESEAEKLVAGMEAGQNITFKDFNTGQLVTVTVTDAMIRAARGKPPKVVEPEPPVEPEPVVEPEPMEGTTTETSETNSTDNTMPEPSERKSELLLPTIPDDTPEKPKEVRNQIGAIRDSFEEGPHRVYLSNLMNGIGGSTSEEEAEELLELAEFSVLLAEEGLQLTPDELIEWGLSRGLTQENIESVKAEGLIEIYLDFLKSSGLALP